MFLNQLNNMKPLAGYVINFLSLKGERTGDRGAGREGLPGSAKGT
jgi:hypothetical protein